MPVITEAELRALVALRPVVADVIHRYDALDLRPALAAIVRLSRVPLTGDRVVVTVDDSLDGITAVGRSGVLVRRDDSKLPYLVHLDEPLSPHLCTVWCRDAERLADQAAVAVSHSDLCPERP